LSRMEAACGPPAPPGGVQLFSSPYPPRSRHTHNLLTCHLRFLYRLSHTVTDKFRERLGISTFPRFPQPKIFPVSLTACPRRGYNRFANAFQSSESQVARQAKV